MATLKTAKTNLKNIRIEITCDDESNRPIEIPRLELMDGEKKIRTYVDQRFVLRRYAFGVVISQKTYVNDGDAHRSPQEQRIDRRKDQTMSSVRE